MELSTDKPIIQKYIKWIKSIDEPCYHENMSRLPMKRPDLQAIWSQMKPGQTVFFKTPKPLVRQSVLCGSIAYFVEKNHPKWKFTIRLRRKENGIRVWRLL